MLSYAHMRERTGIDPSLREIDLGCVYGLDRLRRTRERLEVFAPQYVPEQLGEYVIGLLKESFRRGNRRLR